MRVAILTWGSRGDYQPYVALAEAFRRAGHEVRLGAPPSAGFAELAAAHQIDFAPLGPNVDDRFVAAANSDLDIPTFNAVALIRVILDYMLSPAVVAQLYEECRELSRWADVVVSHFLLIPGQMAAGAAGRPLVTGTLVATQLPTSARPPGNRANLGPLINRRRWKDAIKHMNAAWLGPVNEARARFGLPVLHDVAAGGFYSPDLNLVAMSPTVFTRPKDWRPQHRMTGYWLLGTPDGWAPPPEIAAFLQQGPPPVAIGFGSMISRDSAGLTRTVLDAVQTAGVRAIIEPGRADLGRTGVPDGAVIAEGMPHSWLLPRVTALVHHGGAGTAGAAFHAGIPSVIVPHWLDQHFWAARARKLGVAPEPIPLPELTAERLASAIRRAVSDGRTRERAVRLRETLSRERGTEEAVRLVEEYASSGVRPKKRGTPQEARSPG